MRYPLMTTVAATAVLFGLTTAMAQSGPPEFKTPPGAAHSDAARAPSQSHGGPQHREETAASPRGSDMAPKQQRGEMAAETAGRSGAARGQERAEQGGDRNLPVSFDHERPAEQTASERVHSGQQAAPERDQSRQQAHSEREQPAQGAVERERQRADMPGNHEPRAGSDESSPARSVAVQPGASVSRTEQSAHQDAAGAASPSTSGPASATMSEEQRTKIRQALLQHEVKPVTNANFSISVGATVPERVTLYEVPPSIAEIVPEYRTYRYTVVRDEILIIDPTTRKVIDVIDQNEDPSSTGSINLTQEQRAMVIRTLRDDSAAAIRVGAPVPQCVQLRPVPQSVDVPALRSYQYFTVGHEVVLVDPDKRLVVQILN
jgi:hypothetical protein